MTRHGGQGEALVAWAVAALLLVAVVVTYSRLPARDLYRVSNAGDLVAGIGRGVVLTNYPIALAAIALILIAVDALPRAAWWLAGPALVLCALTGVTVDPKDFDFRTVNLLPAAGVAIAVGLTVAATHRRGASFSPRLPGDRIRIAVTVVVLLLSLPWMAATLGTYFPQGVFLTSKVVTEGKETLPAVHRGEHHGFQCALLFLAALMLSRTRPLGRSIGNALTATLSLMAAYGVVNAAEDFWHEQVVKRGWSSHRIPTGQVPTLSWVWLVILLLAAVAFWLQRLEQRRDDVVGTEPVTSPPSPAHP